MALEARAFTAPGRRTLLRRLPDSRRQQLARWLLLLGSICLVVVSLSGVVKLP
jgi:energy-coupling factor transporter transmembrane protein EcfT